MTQSKTKTVSAEELLAQYPENVVGLANRLRKLIHEVDPGLSEEAYTGVKAIVFGGYNGPCFVAPLKDSANLGFPRGALLADPEGLLRGTGKTMRHVKVRSPEEIQLEAFKALIRAAITEHRS